MKTTSLKITFIATIVTLVAITLQGQEKKSPVTPASKLQGKNPTTVHLANTSGNIPVPVQNLTKFMGRWVGDITIATEGKTHQVEYHLVGRGTAGGYGIYLDESFSDSTLGNLKGANMAGYDPNDSKIHWYSVDNQGTTQEYSGNWKSADSLYLEHGGIRKGKSYKEKININFKGREEMQLLIGATLDGKESKRISGVFNREKPPVKTKVTPVPGQEKKE